MYRIEHRHQDSGWEPSGESYATIDEAVWRAARMAASPMTWGMTRVVDSRDGRAVVAFPAGRG